MPHQQLSATVEHTSVTSNGSWQGEVGLQSDAGVLHEGNMLATHKVGRMIERNMASFLDKEQLPHATQQTELSQ